MPCVAYSPRRLARSVSVPVRGLAYQVQVWGDVASSAQPPLWLVHGWMDQARSFQFLVDHLNAGRCVLVPDWRGFGHTAAPAVDSYWFPDYLGDLDALLQALTPERPVDLAGHSMGGNVVMMYAGVRPQRIRRLLNLEGFGLPATRPEQAPERLARWLDELRQDESFRSSPSLDDAVAKLRAIHKGLSDAQAQWLAPHWYRQDEAGLWWPRGDPAHKRSNPVLYRVDEVLACWQRISAPVLWLQGQHTDMAQWWKGRYSREEFDARLAQVPQLQRAQVAGAGHMMHFDQPQATAQAIEAFLA